MPVYWLGLTGTKIADNYRDLYDGTWGSGACKHESGNSCVALARVLTGSNADGTSHDDPLGGDPHVRQGNPTDISQALNRASTSRTTAKPLYGLSPVFRVAGGNAAPSFTSLASFSAAENQTTVGTVVATDDDTDDNIESYAITGGADQAKFSIDNMGVLTFSSAPDFESPADVASTNPANDAGNNEYIVEVTATSGTGTRAMTAVQRITVTVTCDPNGALLCAQADRGGLQ